MTGVMVTHDKKTAYSACYLENKKVAIHEN
jgi:hypothetical protein